MWHDTTLRDDDVAEELVQPEKGPESDEVRLEKAASDSLLVVADGELQVTGHNTLLLVVTRRVARKLQNLSSKVLKHRREVDYTREVQRLATRERSINFITHQVRLHQHAVRSCPS